MTVEKKIISSSGIPIYVYSNKDVHGFFISLFLRAGSVYETEENNGITHFFEHIAIRNVNAVMGGELYKTLDSYGIEFNATTYSDVVQFFVGGAVKNFAVGASILCSVLSPIKMTAGEIAAERARIKAEIREADDKSSLTVFSGTKVWDGTPLALPITGSTGAVNSIGKRRLEDFRLSVLSPDRIFAYVTGNVSDADLAYLCDELGKYPLSTGACQVYPTIKPFGFGERGPAVHIKSAPFTKVRFNFDLDMTKASLPECDLIYDVIVSADSSDLFTDLSEARGLFYDLSGSLDKYGEVGLFSFSYELREQKIYEALERTVELLKRYKTALLPEGGCMKAGYVDNAPMLLDDSRELNFTMGYENHILGAGYRSLADRQAAYAAVTPERIRSVARLILRPENLTLTLKGNKKRIDLDRIKSIISKL